MLQFPTMAERCAEEFRAATKTVSIVTIAKRMGATVTKNYPETEYHFDDDTSLIVTGAGRNHTMRTELP